MLISPLNVCAVTLARPSPIVNTICPSRRLVPGGSVIGKFAVTPPLIVSEREIGEIFDKLARVIRAGA